MPGTYISTGIKGQPASNQNSKGVKIIQLPCTTRRQRRRWLRPYLPIVSTTRLHGSMLQLRHAKVFSFFPQTLPLSPSPLKLNSTCLIQVATSSAQLASYPVKNILDHRCGERKKIKTELEFCLTETCHVMGVTLDPFIRRICDPDCVQ